MVIVLGRQWSPFRIVSCCPWSAVGKGFAEVTSLALEWRLAVIPMESRPWACTLSKNFRVFPCSPEAHLVDRRAALAGPQEIWVPAPAFPHGELPLALVANGT